MAAPETLKEWKVAITSVRQEYESIEEQQDYKTVLGIIYRERGILMDIEKAKDNFDKNRKSKCFNYNVYGHMVKDCKKPKKERNTKKCYKYEKIEHITKNCRSGRKMKNRSVQKNTDTKSNDKE